MTQLDELYRQIILEESRIQTGKGTPQSFDVSHYEKNPSCGDEITLFLAVSQGKITQICWQGSGCAISMASASVMSRLLNGATLQYAQNAITLFKDMLHSKGSFSIEPGSQAEVILQDALAFEGVGKFVMRIKCAIMAWVALDTCINLYNKSA